VSPIEWILATIAVIAAGAALVAVAIAIGRLGVLAGFAGAHAGRCLREMARAFARFLGGLVVAVLLLPVALARLVLLRAGPARDALAASGREAREAMRALYQFAIAQPLRLVGLSDALGHVERRLPEAIESSSGAETASTERGPRAEFDGYSVLRELRRGGSGARLFVCEPDDHTRARIGLADGLVVIKSFDFDDGTRLAEMLRESRSLDAARRLGLVLDHHSSERRFHYVMRYHDGLDLGAFARKLHEAAGDGGLDRERLVLIASLVRDLVATLREWHAAGLWHKDVKPENIIVLEGRATLVDLGLVTPLASDMTLTTHGTEYFRDPEMVRQALRGTRVSEVDAARFDLYGAGAVLHFALEGTFPAHGVLSSYRKPSPESLRWIARRAMADFDRRYASADEMLRDIDRAILGGDPAAVRPADLPSMGGSRETTATPPPPPDRRALRRPVVRVTNWWTGAYELVSERPLPPAIRAEAGGRLAPPLAVAAAAIAALAGVVALWIWLSGAL